VPLKRFSLLHRTFALNICAAHLHCTFCSAQTIFRHWTFVQFLERFKVLYAGSYRAPRGQDFPPHRHSCWEMVFYRTGNIEAPIGEKVFLTRPGRLLCTPPGISHSERALTAYSNDFISVEAPPDTPWPPMADDDSIGTLSFLCRALVTYFRAGAEARNEAMLALWTAHLDLFLRSYHETAALPSGERVVRAAEHLFEERFATSLEMKVVAAELGVAASALRAHFARFRGYSPSEGLLSVRRQHAFALLRSSDLSLEHIAAATGFYSPSHLSRHIKATTGQSPGQWRRSQDEKD
jgi:AraC-like DNA-binding protein/mannose-6-phosphate isomerase-like protein (cupin superfamily)